MASLLQWVGDALDQVDDTAGQKLAALANQPPQGDEKIEDHAEAEHLEAVGVEAVLPMDEAAALPTVHDEHTTDFDGGDNTGAQAAMTGDDSAGAPVVSDTPPRSSELSAGGGAPAVAVTPVPIPPQSDSFASSSSSSAAAAPVAAQTAHTAPLPSHSTLTDLRQRNAKLLEELEQRDEEVAGLRNVWNQSRESIAKLKLLLEQQKGKYKQKLTEAAAEYKKELQHQKDVHHEQVAELKKLIAENQNEFDEALKAKDSHRSSQSSHMDQLQALSDEYRQEAVDLRVRLRELEKKNTELSQEVEQAKEAALQRVQSVRDEYEKRERKRLEEQKINTETLKEVQFRQSDLEASTVEYTNALAAAQRELEEKSRELQEAIDSRRWLEADKESLQDQLNTVKSQLHQASTELEESRQREEQAQKSSSKRCEALTHELHEARKDAQRCQDEIQELTRKLNAQNSSTYTIRISELEERLRTIADTVITKQAAVERLSSERSALRVQLQSERRRVEALESQNRRLQLKLEEEVGSDGDSGDDTADIEAGLNSNGSLRARRARRSRRGLVRTLPISNPTVASAVGFLDRLGGTIGVALRRNPAVRLFFALYVVLIHLWVAFVLYHFTHHSIDAKPHPHI